MGKAPDNKPKRWYLRKRWIVLGVVLVLLAMLGTTIHLLTRRVVIPIEVDRFIMIGGDRYGVMSEASKRKASPLNYGILEELSTKPRTTYLARIRNPNSDIDHEA